MKCPNCGMELEEGKLLCESCGEEVKIVPDFDIELENELKESISSMLEDMAAQEQTKEAASRTSDDGFSTIKDALSAYSSKESIKIHIFKRAAIVLAVVVTAGVVTAAARYKADTNRYNSFDYQYNTAVACAEVNNYPDAISYLERALAIQPEDLDARFLLAQYYEKNGQDQSTIVLLEEILDGTDYPDKEAVYDMLLSIYEKQSNYERIDALLNDCEISRIVAKYNKYAAHKPEFNKKGGVYEEVISISLKGNTKGTVYYTLDGTEPTEKSDVYEMPILLEAGDYTIRALFVNSYGVKSNVETQHYYINLAAPECPVINPESGCYTKPCLIEAYYDAGTKVYYTTDGSVPDKNSNRYTDPIEMPYGMNNFSFISIDKTGESSEVVNRSYQLEIQANFDTELAIQVLKNSLWADGKLLNVDGNVPGKLGINRYRVQTLYQKEGALYYIVYEEYLDTLGKIHDTNILYAIDVNTADLYRAYKLDEGKYDLRPLPNPNTQNEENENIQDIQEQQEETPE